MSHLARRVRDDEVAEGCAGQHGHDDKHPEAGVSRQPQTIINDLLRDEFAVYNVLKLLDKI